MATLMQASRQWSHRPSDERFLSLDSMHTHFQSIRRASTAKVLPNNVIEAQPISGDDFGLAVVGPNGSPCLPTNWAFGQLCQRSGAPAAYLRALPAPIAADCLNYSIQNREREDLGFLLRRSDTGENTLAAVTGPTYGRIWNEQIVGALRQRFGDGISGEFRVPGEFGKAVTVTKENTTLYASDRDMFVFLADEERRIEIPNRRDGQPGSFARGFFVWNSEVGAQALGVATFLFDYVCKNRIVWGAEEYKEIRIRHTSGAPDRWLGEVMPAIRAYAESSANSVTAAIEHARATPLTAGLFDQKARDEKVREFLAKRFSRSKAAAIQAAHIADEGRPIETLWDAVTGVTAYARGVAYQDERVQLERDAGDLLRKVV